MPLKKYPWEKWLPKINQLFSKGLSYSQIAKILELRDKSDLYLWLHRNCTKIIKQKARPEIPYFIIINRNKNIDITDDK